jgi:hypothetical protein
MYLLTRHELVIPFFKMCNQREKELNLPLFCSFSILLNDLAPTEKVNLMSFGNLAPFEYSDADGGRTTGEYSLHEAICLFDNRKSS